MIDRRVLLLNADAQPLSMLPLSTISWQNAVKAHFQNKVVILDSYDTVLHSANFEMFMPSVVILNRYHRLPKLAKFSRKNLFLRDQHECQYCSKQFANDKLTIDHVIPRSLGGGTSWTNCVASCKKCNSSKGSRLMKPIREPVKPTWHALAYSSKTFGITVPRVEWLDYVDWPAEHVRIAEMSVL